jgi:hypothetical protein
MSSASEKQLRINSQDVAWREIGDEVVVLHMGTATYLSINGTGRTLWNRLADGATRAELIDALIDIYEIDTDRAARDVDSFVESLTATRLISE